MGNEGTRGTPQGTGVCPCLLRRKIQRSSYRTKQGWPHSLNRRTLTPAYAKPARLISALGSWQINRRWRMCKMIVDRRRFLRYVGQGVFLLGSLSVMNSCGGADRDRLSARDRKQRQIAGLTEEEMDILYLASLAPSGHNTQPWTVRIVEPQHWIVGSARERWLPAVDPQNREVLLSIGAFLENLIIAAEVHGYAVDLSYHCQESVR